jgi:23S rRNA (adenine2503-C2)-methyltransferase
VNVLTEEAAPRLSSSHVTVSTSGVLPEMKRFLRESRAHLALSLNATTDEQREGLMPHNRIWPIASLLGRAARGSGQGSRRRYFVEYVLWQDVNDTDEDARRLAPCSPACPRT